MVIMERIAAAIRKMEDIFKGNFYVVGGAVRDTIMGRAPNDIDLSTPLTPSEIGERVAGKTGIELIPSGIEYGTVTIVINGTPYEITTFRRELGYDSNRRPYCVFTRDIKEDALRRDFTINAMYIDRNGNIIDFFGGISDIENRVIRAIGKPTERFREDPVRIARMIRFALRFDFRIDGATYDAARRMSERFNEIVSIERRRKEFIKSGNYIEFIKIATDIGIEPFNKISIIDVPPSVKTYPGIIAYGTTWGRDETYNRFRVTTAEWNAIRFYRGIRDKDYKRAFSAYRSIPLERREELTGINIAFPKFRNRQDYESFIEEQGEKIYSEIFR